MQSASGDELLQYYELLQVKAAYRTLALQVHPDTNANDPAAHDQMQSLNHAYNAILKAREGAK